jgi:mannose-6-phosphate isomerase-like protein (cupin superfamily)
MFLQLKCNNRLPVQEVLDLTQKRHQGGPMQRFESMRLPVERTSIAPDGSDVRVLLGLAGGGMAHFALAPGQSSKAVTHRTVEEIWYFLAGQGEMWREQDGDSEVVEVSAGVCLTIPLGTRFQFRSVGDVALSAVGVTMPPWPGEGEAVVVGGPWQPTVHR